MSSSQGSMSPQPGGSTVWQDRLARYCASVGIPKPVYQDASDIRGCRTAWTSTVRVAGRLINSRYWFDGCYVNNAREDASEFALQMLGVLPLPTDEAKRHAIGALASQAAS